MALQMKPRKWFLYRCIITGHSQYRDVNDEFYSQYEEIYVFAPSHDYALFFAARWADFFVTSVTAISVPNFFNSFYCSASIDEVRQYLNKQEWYNNSLF